MQTGVVKNCHDKMLFDVVNRFVGLSQEEKHIIDTVVEKAWERCMYSFSHINNIRYNTGGIQIYHICQYSMFLYFVANEIYRTYILGGADCPLVRIVCDKIFMVNTAIAGADIYYEQAMPDIFLLGHPGGIVFTPQATIGEYFFFMQGCNIGINNGKAPQLGRGVIMWGDSKIIGNCHVGNHVMFGANSYIKDMDVPDNSIVFGQYPNVIIKENREDEIMSILHERFIF